MHIEEYVSLRDYTTLKTGGVARYFVSVTTRGELLAALAFAAEHQVTALVIGEGSNLLVADSGYPGLIVKMGIMGREYQSLSDGQAALMVGAGEELDAVIADSVAHGYSGLENLSAIPGTVGATPVQNVGAYGVEVKDIILQVEVYDTKVNEFKFLQNKECGFGYRDSIFKSEEGKRYIVVAVQFTLSMTAQSKISYRDLALYFADAPTPSAAAVRDAVMKIREAKFPDWRVLGTAGSFFKNPIIKASEAARLKEMYPDLPTYLTSESEVKLSLGYVLDKICNLKGYRQGAVGLYEAQALVLVNYDGASASEILAFVEKVRMIVREKTAIEIEPEVCIVGK